MKKLGLSTKALHTFYDPSKQDGAIIPPLHLTTTFKFGNEKEYDYSRSGNPTREIFEATIAALDNNKYGLGYSSGSAALANIVSLLKPGDKILFSSDAYGGTYRYIVNVAKNQGVGNLIVDFTDQKATEDVVAKNKDIALIWVETPSNPMLNVVDIEWLSKLAKSVDAMFVVDNTFATPALQQPTDKGADMVVYSTTKYINGHSDSIGGAVTMSDRDLYDRLKFLQNAIGAILSPFDSWLTLRGIRTLEVRMQRHIENADAIVDFLQSHKKIKNLYYPGLNSDHQAEIVKKQMRHPGAMLSVELDSKYDIQKFLDATKYFPLAESLGGVESLIDHPASMTHGSIPKEEREKIGITDGLFRISIGIENKEDLLEDLEQALAKA